MATIGSGILMPVTSSLRCTRFGPAQRDAQHDTWLDLGALILSIHLLSLKVERMQLAGESVDVFGSPALEAIPCVYAGTDSARAEGRRIRPQSVLRGAYGDAQSSMHRVSLCVWARAGP